MNRTLFLLLGLLVFPSLCPAATLDAVFDDPARGFTKMKRANGDCFTLCVVKRRSLERCIPPCSAIERSRLMTRHTVR